MLAVYAVPVHSLSKRHFFLPLIAASGSPISLIVSQVVVLTLTVTQANDCREELRSSGLSVRTYVGGSVMMMKVHLSMAYPRLVNATAIALSFGNSRLFAIPWCGVGRGGE